MVCTGESSCENAQFHVSGSTTQMSLTCIGVNACTQITVTSTAMMNQIICNATSSCNTASVTIEGSLSSIQCGDYPSSCDGLLFTASAPQPGSVSSHILTCDGSTAPCSNVVFNCTRVATDCQVTCSTPESCDNSELLCHGSATCSSNDVSFLVTGGAVIPTEAPTAVPTMPPILQNYVLMETPTDWLSAQHYCQNVYESDLATITNTVDFDDITMYFNISNHVWIGLNHYYQDTWEWMDGSSCDYVTNGTGLCKDDSRWADAYPSDINHTCAIMNATHQGMYTNVNCTVQYPFLCQFIKRVEYICAQNDRFITKRVFQYQTYDRYVSNRTSHHEGILTLSLDHGYWFLNADENNDRLAQCEINGTEFILPTECMDWRWISNQTNYTALMNLTFIDCAFSGICFIRPDSAVAAYNRLTRHYDFVSFDMKENGAIYYSPGGKLYIYPATFLDINSIPMRKYIASNSIHTISDWNSEVVFAYCDIETAESESQWYVFDINDCLQGWKAYGEDHQRSIQIATSECVPTPYPTGVPTVTPNVHFMRWYLYYDVDNGFMTRDGFTQPHFVDSLRNITLTVFFSLFDAVNDGYVAEFEICDVFVDYSDRNSTLGGDGCPFVEPDEVQTQYYAAANFKVYANPSMITDFGEEVMTLFHSGDFVGEFTRMLEDKWGNGIQLADGKAIVVYNLNDTTAITTTEVPIISTDTPTSNSWSERDQLILKYMYTLDAFQVWKDTNYPLFASYLRNATLQTYHNLFTSHDGELPEFEICAVFDDQMVNDAAVEDCPYDIGASTDSDEFSAVAPFSIQYDHLSSFKFSVIAIFESTDFLDGLTVHMNAWIYSISSRRLLSTDFVAVSVDVMDPNDITSGVTSATVDEVSSEIKSDVVDRHKLLDRLFQFAFLAMLSVFAILLVGSYIISSFVWVNHFFRVSAIGTVAIQVMDMLSDVFFTVNASFGRTELNIMIIFILSASFIVIPVVITLIQLWRHMNKHWMKDDKLRSWLSENTKLLYFVSIITGSSFSAVELFNSNLFSLSQFDMGLSRTQLMGYQYKRVYSIVLLENIPQLFLQASYLFVTGGAWDIITATSMAFTIISMVVAIISMLVQKQILFNQDLVIISFDVTGSSVIAKGDRCRNVIRPLHIQMCTILGLDKGLVEMVRPYNIPNGVKVQLNIHIVDDHHETDTNRHDLCHEFKRIMPSAIDSGQLQSSLMDCWKLDSCPQVSNLSIMLKDSKKKARMSVKATDTEMVGAQIDNHERDRLSDAAASFQPGAVAMSMDGDNAPSDHEDDEIIASVNTLGAHGEDDDDDAKSDKSQEDGDMVARADTSGEEMNKREGKMVTTVGDRVKLSGRDRLWGTVMFIGPVRNKEGIYYGIDLDRANKGKNNGTLGKKRYFFTKDGAKSGLFIKKERILQTMAGNNKSIEKRVCVDEVVCVDKFECNGTIRFIGNTLFKPNVIWYGIALHEAKGKNNGTVQGEWYFECEDKYGTFVSNKGFTIIDIVAHVNTLDGEVGS